MTERTEATDGAPPRQLTYAQALREALVEEMERDPRVFVLGQDIASHGGIFKVTDGLLGRFGRDRVRDTPISESAIVGAAVGAAVVGARPVVEIMFVDFLTLGMDQLVNQAAKIRYFSGGHAAVPMVVRTQGGAGGGFAAQHSQSLESWFVHVPGLKVVMPATPADAKGLLKSAIRDDNPVIFIEHKMLYFTKGPVPEGDYLVPLGRADVKRMGQDVTVVATSGMVPRALEAAEQLAAEDIDVEVIDPRTLLPLDTETILSSVHKTNRVVVVVESVGRAGVGSDISALISEEAFFDLDAPVCRVHGRFAPVPYNERLEKAWMPSREQIVDAIRRVLT